MPISPDALAELTKHMAPDDAKLFENLQAKYEPLAGGYLRQSDYDRKQNEIKSKLEENERQTGEWKQWYETNSPIHERLVTEHEQLQNEYKSAQTKLDEALAAVSAGGEKVDEALLAQKVKEMVGTYGFVSQADVNKIVETESAKSAAAKIKEANDAFYKDTLPATVNFSMDAAEIAFSHVNEFKENIDRKAFSEFMTERNITNPKTAYDEFVKPRRDELTMKTRIAEEVKKREDELKQQYSASTAGGFGAPPPGLQEKGAVQMRMERDNTGANNATRIAAMEAAKAMRDEGVF